MRAIRGYLGACLLAGVFLAAAGTVMHGTFAQDPTPGAPGKGEAAARNGIQRVDYAVLPGGRTVIRLTFRGEIADRPRATTTFHPAVNLALDFPNTANEAGKEVFEVGQRELRSIHLVAGKDRLRVVINLTRAVPNQLEISGREVLVTLQRPVTAN